MSAHGACCRRARCSSVWEQTHPVGAVETARQTVVDTVLLNRASELSVPTGEAHEGHRRPQHPTPIGVFTGRTLTGRLHSQDAARRLPDDERIGRPAHPTPSPPARWCPPRIGSGLDRPAARPRPSPCPTTPPDHRQSTPTYLSRARMTQYGRSPMNCGSACWTTSVTPSMWLARARARPNRESPSSTDSRPRRSCLLASPTERCIRCSWRRAWSYSTSTTTRITALGTSAKPTRASNACTVSRASRS